MPAFPGFPHAGYPEGWFGIGWSDDFAPQVARPLKYFGEDLVAYRGASGRLVVMDAFCPHMGAHLGHGGRVEGDCLVCPFHGWSWNADGRNAAIPNSKSTVAKAQIRTWNVVETAPLVFVWYSWRSEKPLWEAPDLSGIVTADAFWDPAASRRAWSNVRVVPQMVAENIVDGSHIRYVHNAADGGHIARLEHEGAVFKVELDQTYVTRAGPVLGKDHINSFGVGVQSADMHFKDVRVVNVLATTPVSEDRCDMRASIFLTLPAGITRPERATDLSDRLQRTIKAHLDSQEQDLPIWGSMRYQPQPLLIGEEVQGHVRFRKWAKRFYAPVNV
jgi:phenylpropionate dioxygenase-like ring-hydroxylating dioxygenase large terminal subunit